MKDHLLTIRLATPADAKELADLHNDIIREEYDEVYSPEALAAWANNDEEKWKAVIQTTTSHFVLGLIDNRIVAAAGLNGAEHRLGVYVLPAWHEQGIGRKMIEKAIEIARTMDIRKLNLSAPAAAVPFYLRLGYTVIAETQHVFENGATMPVFNMELIL